MTKEIRYLVLCGKGADIREVGGPYKTESDAILAKMSITQMSEWGDGDTWVEIEERETVTL